MRRPQQETALLLPSSSSRAARGCVLPAPADSTSISAARIPTPSATSTALIVGGMSAARPLGVVMLALHLACLRSVDAKTSCSSSMPGDLKSTACGAFCKLEKKTNQYAHSASTKPSPNRETRCARAAVYHSSSDPHSCSRSPRSALAAASIASAESAASVRARRHQSQGPCLSSTSQELVVITSAASITTRRTRKRGGSRAAALAAAAAAAAAAAVAAVAAAAAAAAASPPPAAPVVALAAAVEGKVAVVAAAVALVRAVNPLPRRVVAAAIRALGRNAHRL